MTRTKGFSVSGVVSILAVLGIVVVLVFVFAMQTPVQEQATAPSTPQQKTKSDKSIDSASDLSAASNELGAMKLDDTSDTTELVTQANNF